MKVIAEGIAQRVAADARHTVGPTQRLRKGSVKNLGEISTRSSAHRYVSCITFRLPGLPVTLAHETGRAAMLSEFTKEDRLVFYRFFRTNVAFAFLFSAALLAIALAQRAVFN